MKFCWSTLKVKNLDESIKFYKEILGLEVVNRFNAGPMEIAFLGAGAAEIELVCDGEGRDTDVGSDISWGFEVESLDRMLAWVKENGVKVESGPVEPNPHIRFFMIKDPNGMNIQLAEKL